jgi:ubiquinol-cytochrome c reductase cytochrome c1 subunit
MKKLIFGLLVSVPMTVSAADPLVPLEPANINLENKAALQRGASLFVNYCMGCHSAKYMRWQRVADDIGITVEQLDEHLRVTGDQPLAPMEIAMPAEDAAGWFGIAPPDLTLATRSRGDDWVYNYLLNFYVDESKAVGVNNLVFPNVSMPHAMWELQGLQRAVFTETEDADGNVQMEFEGFERITEGSMSPEEYRRAVRDLTTFLAYLADPVKVEREALGIKVIFFLLVLLLFAYLTKREFWKDIH